MSLFSKVQKEENEHEAMNFFKLEPDPSELKVKRSGFQLKMFAFMIGLSVMACVLMFKDTFRFKEETVKQAHVYLELKAVDDRGYPVAGAEVKVDGQLHGKTDSFGEWRRYLKRTAGSALKAEIKKQHQYAVKNLVVPMKERGGEFQLKSSVQLIRKQKIKVNKESTKVAKAAPSAKQLPYGSMWIKVKSNPRAKMNSHLANQVLPRLKKQVLRSGIDLDPKSAWQVELTPLSAGVELIEVQAHYHEDRRSFLRNYRKTPEGSAERILSQLRFHFPRKYSLLRDKGNWFAIVDQRPWSITAKDWLYDKYRRAYRLRAAKPVAGMQRFAVVGKPCPINTERKRCTLNTAGIDFTAPRVGWKRLKLRFSKKLNPGSSVYVAGFAANKNKRGEWVYWGAPKAAANLTVVNAGRIIDRQKIYSLTPKRTLPVAVKALRIARR